MKQPSKKKLIEYFKNALTVECLGDGDFYTLDLTQKIGYNDFCGMFIKNQLTTHSEPDNILLWTKEKGYAKILTYKEKTFSITESQIKELENNCDCDGRAQLKEWFPEVFESEVKLEVGKWYKNAKGLFIFNGVHDKEGFPMGIGFNNGIWDDSLDDGWCKINISYAEEEYIRESLIKEAVKRGFVSPCVYKPTEEITEQVFVKGEERWGFVFDENKLILNNYRVFHKGKWAEIIPTITLSEAEQQLKKKIIV